MTTYSRQHKIGAAAVSFVREMITGCGMISREFSGPDIGVDLMIERDPADGPGYVLLQIKGRTTKWKEGTINDVDDVHLKYWASLKLPFLVVQVHVRETGRAWFGVAAQGVFIGDGLIPLATVLRWNDNAVSLNVPEKSDSEKRAQIFEAFVTEACSRFPDWSPLLSEMVEELLNAARREEADRLLSAHSNDAAKILRHKIARRFTTVWNAEIRESTKELERLVEELKKNGRKPGLLEQSYRELAYGHIHRAIVGGIDECGTVKTGAAIVFGEAHGAFCELNNVRKGLVSQHSDLKDRVDWECANHQLLADLALDWLHRTDECIDATGCDDLGRRAQANFEMASQATGGDRGDAIFTAWRTWLFLSSRDPRLRRRPAHLGGAERCRDRLHEIFSQKGPARSESGTASMLNPLSYADYMLMDAHTHALAGLHDGAAALFKAAERALRGFLFYPENRIWLGMVRKSIVGV